MRTYRRSAEMMAKRGKRLHLREVPSTRDGNRRRHDHRTDLVRKPPSTKGLNIPKQTRSRTSTAVGVRSGTRRSGPTFGIRAHRVARHADVRQLGIGDSLALRCPSLTSKTTKASFLGQRNLLLSRTAAWADSTSVSNSTVKRVRSKHCPRRVGSTNDIDLRSLEDRCRFPTTVAVLVTVTAARKRVGQATFRRPRSNAIVQRANGSRGFFDRPRQCRHRRSKKHGRPRRRKERLSLRHRLNRIRLHPPFALLPAGVRGSHGQPVGPRSTTAWNWAGHAWDRHPLCRPRSDL